jgi:AcrR family transcriptional regulator
MDNRATILECALNLFSARGYDAVGVQEIVEAAGVTKPTLYHYFTNKRGLLDALLEVNFAELLEELQTAAHYQGDLVLTLQNVTQVYFNYARNYPGFYRMQLTMQFASPDSEPNQAVSRFSLEQFRIFETLFSSAAEDHGNMRGRQRAYAATFLGMLNTYIVMFLNEQIELNFTLVYGAVQQYMHGIFS